MGLFDFLKGKKKEETKEIEIKQDSDSIKLNDIEIELPSAEKEESTIKLDLVGEDNTTAINQAVHKAIDGEEIELHTATGGKLYQETADLQQVPPLTEEETKTIQEALTKAVEMSTPKTEELEQIEKVEQEAEKVSQQIQQTEQEQNTEQTKEKKKGFFAKLFAGLDKTRKNILGGVDNVLGAFTKIDEDLFEELEEVLIMADIGVQTTMNIIENLRKRVKKEQIRSEEQTSELQSQR